jgi:transcriptional regulator with XRE-family HTH domain
MWDMLAENFRVNLRNLRKRNRLSQEKLAALLGVSGVSVAIWESPKSNPTVETIERVANALNVHPRVLLEDPAPEPPAKKVKRAS